MVSGRVKVDLYTYSSFSRMFPLTLQVDGPEGPPPSASSVSEEEVFLKTESQVDSQGRGCGYWERGGGGGGSSPSISE